MGIATVDSDLDVVVAVNDLCDCDAYHHLQKFAALYLGTDTQMHALANGIPLVCFKTSAGVHIDLTIVTTNHYGLAAAAYALTLRLEYPPWVLDCGRVVARPQGAACARGAHTRAAERVWGQLRNGVRTSGSGGVTRPHNAAETGGRRDEGEGVAAELLRIRVPLQGGRMR